jgi:hypothetical protein
MKQIIDYMSFHNLKFCYKRAEQNILQHNHLKKYRKCLIYHRHKEISHLLVFEFSKVIHSFNLNENFSFFLDFKDLDSLPSTCQVTQPDPDDLSQYIVAISPDDVNINR